LEGDHLGLTAEGTTFWGVLTVRGWETANSRSAPAGITMSLGVAKSPGVPRKLPCRLIRLFRPTGVKKKGKRGCMGRNSRNLPRPLLVRGFFDKFATLQKGKVGERAIESGLWEEAHL